MNESENVSAMYPGEDTRPRPETTRRDRCYRLGRRAARLSGPQAVAAWSSLATAVEEMGSLDVPKFDNLITAIKQAALIGRCKK